MVDNTDIPVTSVLLEKKLFLKTPSLQWVIISVLVEHLPPFSLLPPLHKELSGYSYRCQFGSFSAAISFLLSKLQK